MSLQIRSRSKAYFDSLSFRTGSAGKLKAIKEVLQPTGQVPKGKSLMTAKAHSLVLYCYAKPSGSRQVLRELVQNVLEDVPTNEEGLDVFTYLAREAENFYKSAQKDLKEYSIQEIHIGKKVDHVKVYFDNKSMMEFRSKDLNTARLEIEEYTVFYRPFLMASLLILEQDQIKAKIVKDDDVYEL